MGGSVAPPAKASESAPTNLGSAGLLPGGFFLLVIRRSRALPEGCGPVSNFFVFLLFVSFFHFFFRKRQVSRRHSTKPRRRTPQRPEYSWTKQHVQTLSMVSDSDVRASERYAEA